jgi:hypothetical protein
LKNRRDKITRLTRKKNFDQKHDNDRNRTFNGQTLPKRQIPPTFESNLFASSGQFAQRMNEPPNVLCVTCSRRLRRLSGSRTC